MTSLAAQSSSGHTPARALQSSADEQYRQLISEILDCGTDRPDRTGVGSRFVTGARIVTDRFPIVALKKVNWQNAISELLWMLSGSTNTADLLRADGQRMKIWDVNQLDYARRYPDAPAGDLGRIYGYQWRNFGGQLDQMTQLVRNMRADKNSRRHMVTAFNPCEIAEAALPPCIPFFQVVLRNVYDGPDGSHYELDMIVTQRSADCLLGLPFNMVQYAALQHMLAHLLCQQHVIVMPGKYVHNIGDAHLYANHLETAKKMLDATSADNDLWWNWRFLLANTGQRELSDFKISDFSIVADRSDRDYSDHDLAIFTGAVN